MRTALVTGATGGLGRHLTAALLREGYAVRATGRDRAAGRALEGLGAAFVAADLTEGDAARALTRGCDVVFHCAALSSPWGPVARFRRTNVDATQALLDAARAAGAGSFVHVSTPSLYFDFRDRTGIREDSPLPARFASAYAATKAEAEARVRTAHAAGLPCSIVRPRAIFGEHDRVLFPRILRVARRGTFPLPRGGRALIDVSYADNVADALILCDRHRERAAGRVFNITNGEPMPVAALLAKLFEALGMRVRLRPLPWAPLAAAAFVLERGAALLPGRPEPPFTRYSLGILGFSQTLDISAARDILGYRPRIPVDEGLARFVAARAAEGAS